MEDSKLIKKISQGDTFSFRQLYNKYVSDLYRFVFSYVQSEQVSDEIVQDTFVKLWLRRGFLDPNQSIKAYLFSISYHQLIKEIRRREKNPLLHDYLDYVESCPVEQPLNYDFTRFLSDLSVAKSRLSPRQRELFELNKEEGIPVKEIASRLSLQEQVVRNQLSSAMKKLRSILSENLSR